MAAVPAEVPGMGDTITLLKSAGGLRLTKKWLADGGVQGYDDARNFRVREAKVSNIVELSELLTRIEPAFDQCIIRGRFRGEAAAQDLAPPELPGHYVRRNVLFDDQALHACMIDIDGFEPIIADPVHDPVAAINEYIWSALPECFRGASYHWQLSSSAGQTKNAGVLKAHVWFWLTRPRTSAELYAWAQSLGSQIDKSVFRRVQILYTAAPVFEAGVADPVPVRSGFVEGPLTESVDLEIDDLVLARARVSDDREEQQPYPDAKAKPGVIGAFCRAYTMQEVFDRWLPEFEFEPGSDRRVTWHGGGGTPGGCFVEGDGDWLVNMHNTDPAKGRACNKFDLVRIHVFGMLDDGDDDNFDVTMLSSYRAMAHEAGQQPEVRQEMVNAKAGQETDAGVPASEEKQDPEGAGAAAPPTVTPGRTNINPPDNGPNVLNPNDFMRLGERVLANKYAGPEGYRLARYDETWYKYLHGVYVEDETEIIRSKVWRYLDRQLKPGRPTQNNPNPPPVPFRPNPAVVTGTLDAMAAQTVVRVKTMPAWIRGWSGPGHDGLINVKNGIFHIGSKQVWPHTQGLFSINQLPFNYDSGADCPQWLKFLSEVFPGDQESIDALQEWFGYLVTTDTTQQKMLTIIGPKRSGKGTIGRVLRSLLGENNVSGPTMALLASNFGLAPMIGKMLMVIPDARASGKDAQAIVERLLMITGEDDVTVDRKNREAWTGQLPCRIVLMSNELPSLGDTSGALNGRMIFLKMEQTFFGREDTGLTRRLHGELPGIFNWALAGLARLVERGCFLQPQTGEELLSEMEALNNPIKGFIDRCCVVGLDASIRKDYLFQAWKNYCRKHDRQAGNRETFSKMLFSAKTGIKSMRPRADGKFVQTYVGITLTTKLLEAIKEETFRDDDDDDYQ